MSVIVKGMEMPQTCNDCLINCEHSLLYVGITDERYPYCPLVEIHTPYGRLIDATFEENHYASMLLNPTPDVTEQDKHKARIVIDALRMARTVIEGSET